MSRNAETTWCVLNTIMDSNIRIQKFVDMDLKICIKILLIWIQTFVSKVSMKTLTNLGPVGPE